MSDLGSIQFPVYKLGISKPDEEDGSLFYVKVDKDGNEEKLLIDNKSWHHSTLGQRRLKMTMSPNIKLFPLKEGIYFLGDLIKLSKSNTWFIDSLGKIFTYTKSTYVNLIIKPIKQYTTILGGCIIEVEDIQARFKCLYAPKSEKYAGILKIGHGYILYGLYKEKPSDTRRLV